MERSVDPNVFETANAGFAQALYEDFLRDPESVGPEWRQLFESGRVGEVPGNNGDGARTVGASDGRTVGEQPSGGPSATTPTVHTAPTVLAVLIKGPAARLVQNMNES